MLPHNHQSHNFYMPFPDSQVFREEYGHLNLTRMRQVDWAESSTRGIALWRGRPNFGYRVIARLGRMRDEAPDVHSRKTLLGRPDTEPSELKAQKAET
ncbi:hypothetical protein [Streptomyces tendae]|uniref:hypothetical protein n=1 Tax=Streptomyces tendae TaxID=1932 RepID=UPI00367D6758